MNLKKTTFEQYKKIGTDNRISKNKLDLILINYRKIKLIFNHFYFFSLRYQRLKSTNSKDAENHLPGINDIF